VAEQQSARLGQLHRAPPAPALDQSLSDERLQRGEVVADCRKRGVQLFRRRPEAARPGDLAQRAQMLEFNAVPVIRNGDILRVKFTLLRSFHLGRLTDMEVLMTVLILVVLAMLAVKWGADSRPLDTDRATPWWPATPRD
jgi:hypothetical protein